MNLNRGELAAGKDCDIIVLDEKNELHAVIIGGEIINGAAAF